MNDSYSPLQSNVVQLIPNGPTFGTGYKLSGSSYDDKLIYPIEPILQLFPKI
jgi:hypothetical protein